MTKIEARKDVFGTMMIADMDANVKHYMLSATASCYELSVFTGEDFETAERVLETLRDAAADVTSIEITELEDTYCVSVEWRWR